MLPPANKRIQVPIIFLFSIFFFPTFYSFCLFVNYIFFVYENWDLLGRKECAIMLRSLVTSLLTGATFSDLIWASKFSEYWTLWVPSSHQIRLETVWLIFVIDVLRYKCVTCQNYDLCRHCEALQLHPAHDMVPKVFRCPVQLDRWHCHSVSESSFDFSSIRALPMIKY